MPRELELIKEIEFGLSPVEASQGSRKNVFFTFVLFGKNKRQVCFTAKVIIWK